MARLKTLGFESDDSSSAQGTPYEWDGADVGILPTISTTVSHSGSRSFRSHALSASIAADGYYKFSSSLAAGPYYYRAYIRIDAAPSAAGAILGFIQQGITPVVIIKLNTNLTLQAYDGNLGTTVGSASSALSLSTWYRVELQMQANSGAATTTAIARIDGTDFFNGTVMASAMNVNSIRWGNSNPDTSGDIYFDDIALNDTTGSFQTSWPGSANVLYLLPNASGDTNTFATQTGGTAGAANNYTRVDDSPTPDQATTFNGSSTLNEEDLFNVADGGLAASDTVNVVEVHGRFRNSTADTAEAVTFELEKTSGGTKTTSTAIVPNATAWRTNARGASGPKNAPIVLYQDPDGSSWTNSTIDSMQIGYKLTTAPGTAGRRIDVTKTWAIVDYTPATGTTITPGVAALTLSSFAPVIASTIIAGLASLSLSAFAPTVSIGQTVTPGVAALTLTTFAPTVAVSDNKLATPGLVSLALSSFAPTVSISDNKLVTPGAVNLSAATFAPTVAVSNNQVATPGVVTLSVSGFAPSLILGTVATPDVASLMLSAFAPTVTLVPPGTYTPAPATLTLTTYAPVVRHSVLARPFFLDTDGNLYLALDEEAGLIEAI